MMIKYLMQISYLNVHIYIYIYEKKKKFLNEISVMRKINHKGLLKLKEIYENE